MPPFKVIIVGGGLAGCLLGNGLHNNGVAVTVYERDAQNEKREGYQIRLGESAMIGFRACLKEEHIVKITEKFGQSAGTSSTAPCLYNSQFQQILDLTALPSYSKSWAINRVVLRNLLSEPLEKAGLVRYGKKFTRYEIFDERLGNEKVRVHFSDGSSDECDILVGADGSGSLVNREVGLENIVPIDTHWSFLNKGSVPISRLAQIPSQLQKGPIMAFCKGGSFFFALYLPAKKDNGTKSSTQLQYDVDEASFYWGLNIPRSYSHHQNAADIPDRLQFCLDFVEDWAPEYHRMLMFGAEHKSSNIYVTPLRASKKPPKDWRKKWLTQGQTAKGHPRVWLIGDAIHAMQPNRGMGGNQALRDCAEMLPELMALSQEAANSSVPSDQAHEACVRYERSMIERAFVWVHRSGGTSAVTMDLDGYAGTLIYFIGKLVVPLLSAMDWVYGLASRR
ncbi:FAD/NAD(P)-binding domain-containing protein [Aspergillus similis]